MFQSPFEFQLPPEILARILKANPSISHKRKKCRAAGPPKKYKKGTIFIGVDGGKAIRTNMYKVRKLTGGNRLKHALSTNMFE